MRSMASQGSFFLSQQMAVDNALDNLDTAIKKKDYTK